MKYYASVINDQEIESSTLTPPARILCSYFYFRTKAKKIQEYIAKQWDVFIDSGAFSAENSKKAIDIDAYCDYIIETGAITYAGLDVIGNAKRSKENIDYMVSKGLKPIPTFHLGSTIDDLDELIDNYSHIALGGLVFSAGVESHCDAVWAHILKRRPTMRVHGFGVTDISLMSRYPWYSVDSSSFKRCKRFGRQGILYNDFNFETFSEKDYLSLLEKQGYKTEGMTNQQKNFLYDYYSVQSYKLFAAHLKAVNRNKDFSYLTSQQTLF